jgi:phospholipid transport system substrate-binding protein
MTALAMGQGLEQGDCGSKEKLAEEFKNLLVRTYSNALTAYKDQTIRYKPLKMQPGDTEVVVQDRDSSARPATDPARLLLKRAERRLEGVRRGRGRRQPGDQLS